MLRMQLNGPQPSLQISDFIDFIDQSNSSGSAGQLSSPQQHHHHHLLLDHLHHTHGAPAFNPSPSELLSMQVTPRSCYSHHAYRNSNLSTAAESLHNVFRCLSARLTMIRIYWDHLWTQWNPIAASTWWFALTTAQKTWLFFLYLNAAGDLGVIQ